MLPLAGMLAVLLLENDDLAPAPRPDDGGDDGRAADGRGSDLRLVTADQEHVVERDLVLIDAAEDVALDRDRRAFLDPILLSTRPNDGVHTTSRKWAQRFSTLGCPASN